ncbi:uncharacterized protein LOC111047379 isoform X2 [Nilaparvata lugens]|uniref:uncharacterized protein LOC111047379 isoform X2 n=1 Tax=Nilaparvata lugens TaxID=108931 RepID=UPI00193C95E3|nr:uncharacterized protein LOC111047379 isoform X2 [Nilaparvata lugens]
MFPACKVQDSIFKLNKSYDMIRNIILISDHLDLDFIKVKYKMTKRKSEMIDNITSLFTTLEKIGECNAFDKFCTVEFLTVFVNNNELKDLVSKHRRLLDITDYDSFLLMNKFATITGSQSKEKSTYFRGKEDGLSQKDVNTICKNIGPDKWKPLARHMKDESSQYIFDESLICEINSRHTSTELKLQELDTTYSIQ